MLNRIISRMIARWRPLLLAGLALLICLATGGVAGRAGARTLPTRLFQSPLRLVQDAPCISHADNGVVFDFMGYEMDADGTTTLTVRITNPHRQPAQVVTFTAAGWTRVAPAARSVYRGDAGAYRVHWFLHQATPRQQGFRFVARGARLRNGAAETFRLTVRDFDPNAVVAAWMRAGRYVAEVHGRPVQHGCDRTVPTPTPTPTATPTAPFSPLPTPTPTPEGGVPFATAPQVATCVFGPSPDGVLEGPILPLERYSFSEPTLVLTNTASIGLQQWLPDNETLLVTRHTGYGNKLELVHIHTKALTELVAPHRAIDSPRWLSTEQTVVWREVGSPGHAAGYWARSFDPAGERRLSDNGTGAGVPHDVSPDGKEFLFMSLPGGTQPFIWNQETKTLRALPVDLNNWRYRNGPRYPLRPFNVDWHPSGDQILFWDGTWIFLYDLTTHSGCEIERSGSFFLRKASWSPNGRYLLTRIGEHFSSIYAPHNLVEILDIYTGERIRYSLGSAIYSFAWGANNQTVIVVGRNEQQVRFPDGDTVNSVSLYLLNVLSGEYKQILPDYFAGAIQGMAWSSDGSRLAFLGSPLDGNEITGTGGVFVSQVTVNQ